MQELSSVSRDKLVSLISVLIGGMPDPDDPPPPGPWDPIIHRALKQLPHPDPWRLGAFSDWTWAALNPQPLPPRIRFAIALAEQVAERAMMLRDLSLVLPDEAQSKAFEKAKDFIGRFIDDCGTGRIPPWKRWPPPPPPWPPQDETLLGPLDLIAMGAAFNNLAALMVDDESRSLLANAGEHLLDAGLSKL
jgi:hypothetical protein